MNVKTYLKTLYVSIIFCIFTAYAYQSYSGTVSGGGGSEVEANFIAKAHTLISAFKDHSEVDFKPIDEAFSSLKDIEVVDVLRDRKGSPIPNANLHYAWVEDGILKLRGDWWASQFEKNKDVTVAVAHELFRVAFWYSAGDKKFNDDKYQITIGKMHLAGENLAEILLPNICQPASYRTLDTHVFSEITTDQDGGRYDACPAVSASKIVLKVPSGRVQVKHLVLVLQNEKIITLDDLIAYGEPNAKRYKDGFINSGEAVELFFNSHENVKAYSLFLESFTRGSSVEVTLSYATGLKSRLIKLTEKHDTVTAGVIETDDLPIMSSFNEHLVRVNKMDRAGSFVKYAAYLDELERVIDDHSNIVNDLKYSKTKAAADKARADEAKKRKDTTTPTQPPPQQYTPNPDYYVPTASADRGDDIACSMANNSESHCRGLAFCQWISTPGSCLGRRAQDNIPCSMSNNSQRTCNGLSICMWVGGQGSCVGRRR